MSARPPKALQAYGVLPGADEVVELGDLGTWRPKLVATDLDGTLLDATGEVSPRTRAALAACWDAGIPVVGVTGRGPRLLDSVRAALDGRGIAVLAQGGFVVDLERDEVLRTVALPRTQAAAVIERIETVTGELVLAVEDAAQQGEVHARLRVQHGFDWPYPEGAELLSREEVLPAEAVLKVFLRSPGIGQDELLARARSVVDPADAELTHAGLGFIEVLPPGITKASGLAIALERYGVDLGDVLVFGDMPNDLPMLTAVADAGGRAIAVANAHPAVHAVVHGTTSGHRADGVARYLEAVLDV
ncbi:HAD family hydrolase [Blastococcus saxobsidens]|uniref:HAD-superfamily hydrolase, subfamily IIB n=1 Tax=Blastococcus saxobsidens (strain DD2) TaxID=1146883 RepID=H6RLA7_BLASD|nr:HAD family hydrolase [Blastococcus saxobsidens]CCG01237.1 HAD-superfamily hydrolase, subfamily IIB [Blastococcus saxobsidens DD2]